MKKIIGITLAAICLLGCDKKNGIQEFHDPLLRQQLTTMVASLSETDDISAKKAIADIDAILTVNSTKLNEDQKKKLNSAKWSLVISPSTNSMKPWEASPREF
jgi:hypothetical protein